MTGCGRTAPWNPFKALRSGFRPYWNVMCQEPRVFWNARLPLQDYFSKMLRGFPTKRGKLR